MESRIGTIHEDVTTDVLGNIGSWQWLITFSSTILTVPCFFNEQEDTFLLQPSKEVLCIPEESYPLANKSLCTYNNGTTEIPCKKWYIKLMWLIWFKKSWLVFCDDKMTLMSTAVICRLGLAFGCAIFGLFSDSFGRRIAIVINVIIEVILRYVLVFCSSESWYRLFIFLRSLAGSGNLYMGIIMVCEIASNKWRSWLITIATLPRLMAMVCMMPLANSAPNSETYSFIGCLFGSALIVILRWIPDSPQWLLYNRKMQVAEKILYEAAKRNGYTYSGDFKIRPVNHRVYTCLDETTTCIGILRIYNIRVIIFISLLFWTLFYFLWGNLYLRVYSENNTNNFLIEVCCCLCVCGSVTILLSTKLRLRYLLMIHIILSGAFTVSTTFCVNETFHSLLSSLALASSIVGQALILNITPRLYALNVRATLFGCCHATGQLGTIISHLIFLFDGMDDITYVIVEIIVTAVLVALCFGVPDVDGRELPDVVEDMDYFLELSKPLRWVTQKSSSPSNEEVIIRIHSFGSASVNRQNLSAERLPAQRLGFIRKQNRHKPTRALSK